jgi:hypothetical protein
MTTVVTVINTHLQQNVTWGTPSTPMTDLEVYDNAVSSAAIELNSTTQSVSIQETLLLVKARTGAFAKRFLGYLFGLPHPSAYLRGKESD